MVDYKKMYLELFNATESTIEILKRAQLRRRFLFPQMARLKATLTN